LEKRTDSEALTAKIQAAESDLAIAKNERRKVAHGMQEIKFQKGEIDHEI